MFSSVDFSRLETGVDDELIDENDESEEYNEEPSIE